MSKKKIKRKKTCLKASPQNYVSELDIAQKLIDGANSDTILFDPKLLSRMARRNIIEFMIVEGLSQASIAKAFRCSVRNIKDIISHIKEQHGKENVEFIELLDKKKLAGDAARKADFLYMRAVKEKDYRTAWYITSQLPETLIKWGVMKAPTQEHNITYTEQQLSEGINNGLGFLRKYGIDYSQRITS